MNMVAKISRVVFGVVFLAMLSGGSAYGWNSAQYNVDPIYTLQITPPPNAYFEIPFWVVPGGWRQLTLSTGWTYKCYTPLNPLTDTIQLPSSDCILTTWPFVPKQGVYTSNPAAVEWGRNYNGIFSQHWITFEGKDRLIAFGVGENKNENLGGECGVGGVCYQNTINTDVICSKDHSSGYCAGNYSDDWDSYNAFINLSWQFFDEIHKWGMLPHVEEGPIIWPADGYTDNGNKTSSGVKIPYGFVEKDYIWLYYADGSFQSPGIKVARAPITSGGLPGNWQTYCNGSWVNSLPSGFDVNRISDFYSRKGGCASNILQSVGGYQDGFAVAKTLQGGYVGIEEHHDDQMWQLKLWRSFDLINWSLTQTILSTDGGWSVGELHYPVFLATDGWHNDFINENDFYIVGTKNDAVRAMRVSRNQNLLYLPFIRR